MANIGFASTRAHDWISALACRVCRVHPSCVVTGWVQVIITTEGVAISHGISSFGLRPPAYQVTLTTNRALANLPYDQDLVLERTDDSEFERWYKGKLFRRVRFTTQEPSTKERAHGKEDYPGRPQEQEADPSLGDATYSHLH